MGVEVLKGATITNTSGSDLLLLVEGRLPGDFGFGLRVNSPSLLRRFALA